MDPRIGKANYGEGFRKLFKTEADDVKKPASHDQHAYSDSISSFAEKKLNNSNEHLNEKKPKNYRLVADPFLKQGSKKVYSVNGVVPGVSDPLVITDPRPRKSRLSHRKDPLDLPILIFKYDQFSVGTILPKEVTFSNLNNNIDKSFLTNLCKPYGEIEHLTIHYHPETKKHLGIGSVIFGSTKSAKLCCEKLNKASSMGNIMNVFIDIGGEERIKVLEELTAKKSVVKNLNSVSTPTLSGSSFKSPSQGRLQKTSSTSNMMDLCIKNHIESSSDLSTQQSDASFNGHLSYNNNNNGTFSTGNDMPTPSYSDVGYFSSSHQSDASEAILSSGSESVGSGNSSIILPVDPRLSKAKEVSGKDGCRLASESPMGSDEFVVPGNALSSPFMLENVKHSRQNAATINSSSMTSNNPVYSNFIYPSPSVFDAETDQQMQSRDPRIARSKSFLTNSTAVNENSNSPVTKVKENIGTAHMSSMIPSTSSIIVIDDDDDDVPREKNADGSNKDEKSEAQLMSLDSRIEAMLNQKSSFGIPKEASCSLSPLPDNSLEQTKEPESENTKKQNDDDCECVDNEDDRMSMSSADDLNNDIIEMNVPAAKETSWLQKPPPLPPQWPPGFMFPYMGHLAMPMMPPYISGPRYFNVYDMPDFQKVSVGVQESSEAANFRKVLEEIVTQMQTVLSKDLRRKMVESTAFEVFDEWWSKNDLLDKKCSSGLFPHGSRSFSTNPNPAVNDSGSSVLNFLFEGQDQGNQGFGSGGLLGLRGIAAKLPSFRKKYKAPTPTPELEDENVSHCITHASDSESDEEEDQVDNKEDDDENSDSSIKFNASSESESNESSSAESEEEEDSDDDDSEAVSKKKLRKSRNDVYESSDEESDEEEEEEDSCSESGGTAIASDESENEYTKLLKGDFDDNLKQLPHEGNNLAIQEELREERKPKVRRKRVMDSSDEECFEKMLKKSKVNVESQISEEFNEDNFKSSSKRKRSLYEDQSFDSEEKSQKKLKYSDETNDLLISNMHTDIPHPAVPGSESHTSCRLFFPSQNSSGPSHPTIFNHDQGTPQFSPKSHKLSDVTNKISETIVQTKTKSLRELQRLQCTFISSTRKPQPKVEFLQRDYEAEANILFSFTTDGIDTEDITYLKKSYEQLILADFPQTNWLNETHWFDHGPTYVPPPSISQGRSHKRKAVDEFETRHKTGSARTEGYYKISRDEKERYLQDIMGVQNHVLAVNSNETDASLAMGSGLKKKLQQHSRDARSESRRWQSFFASKGEDLGDLLKFNQLKFRKKQLKFAKSGIHDWGLFALEKIQEGEMVIEYVGQVIRQSIADIREQRYEATGIGSSYLFRIDGDTIVDATKYGNLARFINHCCTPNCCAKIVTVDSQKKIVIYSRRDIEVNEEITYDYKFPLEDKKIPCLCGSSGCRGSLN